MFVCTSEYTNASVVDGYVYICITTYRYKEDNDLVGEVSAKECPDTEKGTQQVRVEETWRRTNAMKLPKHYKLD